MDDETFTDIDGLLIAVEEEEASAAPDDSADSVIKRAEQKLKRAGDRAKDATEAGYLLAKFAQEEAVLELREAKRLAAEAQTQELLAPLQEQREDLLRQLEQVQPKLTESNLDADKEAFGLVSAHVSQLVAELDLEIGQIEGTVPFAHLKDEQLGRVELQTADKQTGALLARPQIINAAGEVGSALREVEDAKLTYTKLLEERGEDSLRTKDALSALNEANLRAESLRTEIDRRAGQKELESVQASEAMDRATERAEIIDQQARDRIKAANMSTEDRAVALAKLSVPMSERKADAKEWSTLLDDAMDEVKSERHAREISSELGGKSVLNDSALMEYLRTGKRLIAENFNSIMEVDPYQAKALRALGGFEGNPQTEAEKILAQQGNRTQGEEFYDRIAESAEYNKRRQREEAEKLSGR